MNSNIQLTPHFNLSEFLHKKSLEGVMPEIVENLRKLAMALEGVRVTLGNREMTITSGFRTWAHHVAIYAAMGIPESEVPKDSYHLKGLAADFVVKGLPPKVVQEILKDWNGGLEIAPTWTHCDLGPKRRFFA